MLTNTVNDAPRWSAAKRFSFGIAFTYFVLYQIDAFLGLFGPVLRVMRSPVGARALYRIPWDYLDTWIAVHVFSVDPRILVPFGGGFDAAINYARAGCFLLTAIIVGFVWSATDRRSDYATLYRWLSDFLRFALAITLFFYGVNKVIPVQMLPAHLYTTALIQPFGDKSPAGLLWSFVGYSVPYQMFSGAVEVLASLLLLTRRTLAVGALLALAATVNVAVLDLCYDVSLKLITLNLVAVAVFLAWPALTVIVRLFVLDQRVAPSPVVRSVRPGWFSTAARFTFAVLLAIYAYQTVAAAYTEYRLQVGLPTTTPLYGIYNVEAFRRNGADVPPLTTDDHRWRRIVVESPRVVQVQRMDDSFDQYRAESNPGVMQLKLFRGGPNSNPVGMFTWSASDADHVELDGNLGSDTLQVALTRIDQNKFPLMSMGFRWVQNGRYSDTR
jgi:hypothetical protein